MTARWSPPYSGAFGAGIGRRANSRSPKRGDPGFGISADADADAGQQALKPKTFAPALHEDTAAGSPRLVGIYRSARYRVLQFYEWTLRGALRHPLTSISLILASLLLFVWRGAQGFYPMAIRDFFGSTEAVGISFDDMITSNAITESQKDPNDSNIQRGEKSVARQHDLSWFEVLGQRKAPMK